MSINALVSKHLFKVVKAIEKEGRLSLIQNTTAFPLSTGSLTLDYFYNGGILPVMYTIAGPEQSGKTLTSASILASAYKQDVQGLVYFDAEETLNSDTVKNLFSVPNVAELFAITKQGKTEVAPRVHVFKGNSLEGVMDGVTNIVNSLLDKTYIDSEEAWYFKLSKDVKEEKAMVEELGLTVDLQATKKYGGDKFILCKDPTSKPKESGVQAVIIIDSLAMLLADSEEEEGASAQMALEARKFAKNLKRFVGRLTRKQVVVIGINHLRENPGARFSNPSYEPCGSAVRFSASVQTRVSSVSSSTAGWGGAGSVYEEESIHQEGFKDRYQFKKFRLVKDKVGGGVNNTVTLRVWIEDCYGEPRGFDPVQDTIEFLKLTSQLEEKRGRYVITTHPLLKDKSLTFKQLKKLILATSIDDNRYRLTAEEFQEEFSIPSDLDLRNWCFSQIKSREAFGFKDLNLTGLDSGKESEASTEDFDPETGEVLKNKVDQY